MNYGKCDWEHLTAISVLGVVQSSKSWCNSEPSANGCLQVLNVSSKGFAGIRVLRAFRVLRLFKVFKYIKVLTAYQPDYVMQVPHAR